VLTDCCFGDSHLSPQPTNDTPTLRRRAGGPTDSGSCVLASFQGQASSGFEMSDCRILLGLLPQLECAPHRHIGWKACLLKVSFNMPGLLKKFLSNNKLGDNSG
jgi:hypothetical protein